MRRRSLPGGSAMGNPGKHEKDVSMKAMVKFDGAHISPRKRLKNQSKVAPEELQPIWEEFQPIYLNGKVQFADCLHCHNRLGYNGNIFLRRHLKTCPAKPESTSAEVTEWMSPQDSCLPIVTIDDISSVSPLKWRSKIWEGFTPIFVEGKLQGAECIHCHKRLSKHGGHLNRHALACSKRHGHDQSHHKGNRSSLPKLKSRVRDESSPARKAQITKCSSKLRRASSSSVITYQPIQVVADLLSLQAPGGTKCSSKLRRASSSSGITYRPIQVVADHLSLPAPDGTGLKKQKTSSMTNAAAISTRKFGQDSPYQDIARLITLHGYPLSIVENEDMRRILKNISPMTNKVSLSDMEEHLLALFQKKKINVKDEIALTSQRISLSASIWTHDGPEPTVNYLCLTAHFITEDWKIHRLVIKFGMYSPTNLERIIHCKEACVPESESGSYNVIWDAIRDWNLDQKILSLTSVGEIKNDANTLKLKEMLIKKRCLPIRGKLYNIACVDDMLNSVVSDGRSYILFLVGDIVKDFFGACASSSSMQQQLLEVISQMSLKCPQEDAKWWHKLYFRLEVVLQFNKLFPAAEVLSPEDMTATWPICKILRTFYRVIEVISSPSSPTANVYFSEVWKVRTVLQEEASNDHAEIVTLVMEMQEAFDEYWQNSYVWLSIPVVLDPRFKMSFIQFRLQRAYSADSLGYLSEIHDTVQELFDEYYNATEQLSGVRLLRSAALDTADNDPLEDWDEHLNCQMSSELDDYLGEVLVPRKDDFDILKWWMEHTTKYPTLAAIARDVLAMPASAVQSEAAFSSSRPVIPKHQSTLSIETIEALVCSRDWMR
ncbi:zinc finger BED domain-containing protein RICESLEEPER 2-like [Triticum dicoccoides]|nr:zinc finger BED domain-containing protein RICESLEEPER 2-like [Triticum dicoccoides]